MKLPLHTQILKTAARKIGAKIKIIDRKTGYLSEVEHQGQKKIFGLANIPRFPLNEATGHTLARDKSFTYLILRKSGLKVPQGDYFFKTNSSYFSESLKKEKGKENNFKNQGLKEALNYAKKIGFPVFLKPNQLAGGKFCQIIENPAELKKKIKKIFEIDYIIIIQKPIILPEYRLVVLDDEIILGYQKTPPYVIGDGFCTLESLVKKKFLKRYSKDFYETIINNETLEKFKKYNLTFSSILKKGQKFFLKDTANLSSGGEIVQILNNFSPTLKTLIKKISSICGLRFYGMDLMTSSIQTLKKYYILEVNSNPSFLEFYLKDQQKIIEIYQKIIKKSFTPTPMYRCGGEWVT